MRYERLWERLLEFLNGWSTATVTGPDRIKLLIEQTDGTSRVLEIEMSPEQWDQMVTIPWGDFDAAAQEVRKAVYALPDDKRFLVYGDYELVPSATADVPVDHEDERLAELARQHPEGFGRWAVLDGEGRVVDEFNP